MTGTEYANLIAAYLARNYGPRGLVVYREVSLGKSIIGKNRRVDVFAIHQESQKALAVECKVQSSAGTADEKIPYTLQDLAAMHVPAFVVYAGSGFSEGVLHLLRSSELAAYCLPEPTLEPSANTLELDHLVAMTFGWWDAVLRDKKPFAIGSYSPPVLAPAPAHDSASTRAPVPGPAFPDASPARVPEHSRAVPGPDSPSVVTTFVVPESSRDPSSN